MKEIKDINRIKAGDIETPKTLLMSYCNLSVVVISNLNVEFINTAYLQIVGRMFESISANPLFLAVFNKLKSFYKFNEDEQDLYIFILIFQKRKDDELFIIKDLNLTCEELLLVNQIKDYFKVFGNILKTVSEMLLGRKNLGLD